MTNPKCEMDVEVSKTLSFEVFLKEIEDITLIQAYWCILILFSQLLFDFRSFVLFEFNLSFENWILI